EAVAARERHVAEIRIAAIEIERRRSILRREVARDRAADVRLVLRQRIRRVELQTLREALAELNAEALIPRAGAVVARGDDVPVLERPRVADRGVAQRVGVDLVQVGTPHQIAGARPDVADPDADAGSEIAIDGERPLNRPRILQ